MKKKESKAAKKEKPSISVYQFLKEALIRKFGTEFYEGLEQVAAGHFDEKEQKKK